MSETINLLTLALELIVTFAGVFLAFMLDRLIDWRKEQKTKEELLKNLAYELNRMKDNLTGDAYSSILIFGIQLLQVENLTF